jgi:uncharacterized membrane protein YoaT (DUF817 family)
MKIAFTLSDFKWPIVFLCALFTYVAIIVFRESAILTLLSVASLGVLMLKASWSWEHFIVYITLFVMAIFTETLCVYLGIWRYSMAGLFGVPLWVPFMWANSGLFVIELKEAIDGYIGRA